ncbi:DNA (cytosine-5-)-methyltransferase [Orobanche gracilis]
MAPDTTIVSDAKKESLSKMMFYVAEVQFFMDTLGIPATIGQLMDFIFATRIAKKYENDASDRAKRNSTSRKSYTDTHTCGPNIFAQLRNKMR